MHQPTLESPPSSAPRVGAVVLAAVQAELLRLDGDVADDPVGNDADANDENGAPAKPSFGPTSWHRVANSYRVSAEETGAPREQHR